MGHTQTIHRLLRGKQSQLYFLFVLISCSSVKYQPELLSVFAIKIRTMRRVNPTLCPRCPAIGNMQLTSAPPWHLTKASNQRQRACMMVFFAEKQSSDAGGPTLIRRVSIIIRSSVVALMHHWVDGPLLLLPFQQHLGRRARLEHSAMLWKQMRDPTQRLGDQR